MIKQLALGAAVVGVALSGGLAGVSTASADSARCDKPVTQVVHGAHETVEGSGEDTAAEFATEAVAGALHGSEAVTCRLPV